MNTTSSFAIAAVRGVLCGFDEHGDPLIDFPSKADRTPVTAISTVPLQPADVNREVVLVFEDGDPDRPIIVGLRQPPQTQRALSVEIDGDRLVYTAQNELVLRCGKASIQLLSDGSVRIRGTNLLSRASATNRIRGGNIQLN